MNHNHNMVSPMKASLILLATLFSVIIPTSSVAVWRPYWSFTVAPRVRTQTQQVWRQSRP